MVFLVNATHDDRRSVSDQHSTRGASRAHTITGIGIAGYLVLLVAVVLIVGAIGTAAGDGSGVAWWILGAVVAAAVGIGLLIAGRSLATRSPGGDSRIQQDPLQPEVTAEEEQHYIDDYRDGPLH